MTTRRLIILSVITTVLLLQFVVPVTQYFDEGANRWGWQMYSRENPNPGVVAVTAEGERTDVRLGDHLFHRRAEIRIDDLMLRQLCERIPEAEQFELEYDEREVVTVYRCNE